MSRANTWFNKMDRLFLLSPSFYTILSGALIGASINLLTGLIFTKEALSIYVIDNYSSAMLFGITGLYRSYS